MLVKTYRRLLSRKLDRLSLRTILIVPFILQLFGVVGLVGYLSFQSSHDAVRDLVVQVESEASARVNRYLDSYLIISEQIDRINADAIDLGMLNVQNFEQMGQYFSKQMSVFSVSSISYGTIWGEFVGVERLANGELRLNLVAKESTSGRLFVYKTDSEGRAKELLETKDWDPRSEPWYTNTVQFGKPMWSPIYQWEDKPEVMSIAMNYPVYDRERQNLLGVLSIDSTLWQINSFLQNIRVSEGSRIFIIERNGLMVASSTAEQPYRIVDNKAQRLAAQDSQDPLIQASMQQLQAKIGSLEAIRGEKTLEFKFDENTRPSQLDLPRFLHDNTNHFLHVIPYQNNLGLDWLLVVSIPERDFMQRIHANTRWTIAICLAALGLATTVGLLTAGRIVRQLQQLGKASDAIASGLLDQKISVRGYKELHALAKSFNWMAAQLRESFVALDRANEELEQRVEERTRKLKQEIQERQLIEQKLQVSEAEIRGFFEAMSEVVLIVNSEKDDISIAPTNVARFYANRADILNRTIELFFGENSELVKDRIQEALDSQQIVEYEYCFRISPEKSGQGAPDPCKRIVGNVGNIPSFLTLDCPEVEVVWFSASISPISEGEVAWVARDVTARKQAEEALERKAVRDRLLGQVSRALMEADLDAAIGSVLEQIGQFTESDRAYITRYNPKRSQFANTHEWQGPETPSFIEELQNINAATRPWLFERYQASQPIYIRSSEDLPPEATRERAAMQKQGIQSMLHVPMLYADRIVGFIGLETVRSQTLWSSEDVQLLTLIGEIIALAQARHDAEDALRLERERADRLLLNVLPAPIAEKLKQRQSPIAEDFEEVTILFADIVGFTTLAAALPPIKLVTLLDEIFSTFDELAASMGLEKIKTIGDSYMVAAGLPIPRADHVEAIANMALAMQATITFVQTTPVFQSTNIQGKLQLRIGFNTGRVVAGVIGTTKFIYDLWGDAVNIASRMESSGKPGQIQVTEAIYEVLKDRYRLEKRGTIPVKGKGEMMTYWLLGKRSNS